MTHTAAGSKNKEAEIEPDLVFIQLFVLLAARSLDDAHIFYVVKQKTAYEIMPSLVGSEMCIRDRFSTECFLKFRGSVGRNRPDCV